MRVTSTLDSHFLLSKMLNIMSTNPNSISNPEYELCMDKIYQDCHPRNTLDGSRQGSYELIESPLILF